MKLVENFYNVVMYGNDGIAPTYFPDYMTNSTEKYQQAKYVVECFSNGCIDKPTMLKRLSKACNCAIEDIARLINRYIE